MSGIIADILENSIAEELELEAGDEVVAINGYEINDLIDFNYHTADEEFTMLVRKKSGEKICFDISHYPYEDIGIEFTDNVFDGIRSCRNNCSFCFVSQLPEGCRKTMYLKDDDYRMSFMEGSYITGTNLSEEDYERIFRMRLSPLYISIHTTNPELRVQLLKNPAAANIKELLTRLKDNDIYINGQLVLCPGINDGKELINTIEDLMEYTPQLFSLALVPVGLTEFCKHPEIRLYQPDEAAEVIRIAQKYQGKLGEDNFIYVADEFYLIAGQKMPEAEHYKEFSQIENGVGMTAALYDEWNCVNNELPKNFNEPLELNFITGISGAAVLQPIIDDLNKIENLKVNIFPVKNSFFGESVTVTGLVTGSCILKGLEEWRRQQTQKPKIIIPDVMLKFDVPVFLDDMTVDELAEKLDADIQVVANGVQGILEALGAEFLYEEI